MELISNFLLKPQGAKSFSTSALFVKAFRIDIYTHPVSDLNKRSFCLILLYYGHRFVGNPLVWSLNVFAKLAAHSCIGRVFFYQVAEMK